MTTRLGNLHREYNYWYARGVNGSLSRRRCADGLEHMCSQGRLFATPITGTSNKFRPRQRCLRGPTHGKCLYYNILPDILNLLRKVKSSIAVIVSPLMKDQVRARLTLCAYVYARMNGAKIPLHIPSDFKNLPDRFFLPRAYVEKTGWFTRLPPDPPKRLDCPPPPPFHNSWIRHCFIQDYA